MSPLVWVGLLPEASTMVMASIEGATRSRMMSSLFISEILPAASIT